MIDKDQLNKELWWQIEKYFSTEEERDDLLELLVLAFSKGYQEGYGEGRDYGC